MTIAAADIGLRVPPSDAAGVVRRSAPWPGAGLIASQKSFARVLGRAWSGGGGEEGGSGPSKDEKARESAEQLVAIAFLQPLFTQLRQTNSAAPPFAPSSGERQFRALLDAQLAQRMAHASRLPLVDAVARKLLEHGSEPRPAPGDRAPAVTGADVAREARSGLAQHQPAGNMSLAPFSSSTR